MVSERLQLMPAVSHFAKHAAKTVGAKHVADALCQATHLPSTSKVPALYTTGCEGETIFEIPVDDSHNDFAKSEPARICVVDDMAYMFPKYGADSLGDLE